MEAETMTDSLYQRLVDAGVPVDHHESDLYFKGTPEAVAIHAAYFKEHGFPRVTRFFNLATRDGWWLDAPFCWQPFWDRAHARLRDDDTPYRQSPLDNPSAVVQAQADNPKER
jgi:hypothetical protein